MLGVGFIEVDLSQCHDIDGLDDEFLCPMELERDVDVTEQVRGRLGIERDRALDTVHLAASTPRLRLIEGKIERGWRQAIGILEQGDTGNFVEACEFYDSHWHGDLIPWCGLRIIERVEIP